MHSWNGPMLLCSVLHKAWYHSRTCNRGRGGMLQEMIRISNL
jgi:hypothetical protein